MLIINDKSTTFLIFCLTLFLVQLCTWYFYWNKSIYLILFTFIISYFQSMQLLSSQMLTQLLLYSLHLFSNELFLDAFAKIRLRLIITLLFRTLCRFCCQLERMGICQVLLVTLVSRILISMTQYYQKT